MLQLRYDVFPLRNRSIRQNYQGTAGNQDMHASKEQLNLYSLLEEEDELFHEWQRQYYESNKVFYILRDQFLLTKVHITGVVVFQIRKDDRMLFGSNNMLSIYLTM